MKQAETAVGSSETPWAQPVDETLDQLNTSLSEGLSEAEVRSRRKQAGRNVLPRKESRSVLNILVDQFRSIVIGLLALAAIVSLVFGQYVEAGAIAIAIFINTAIGFIIELKAVRSMEALRELSSVNTVVRRESRVYEVPAEDLVPGDIVVIEGGDIVTADLRLAEANKIQIDESALTGESAPVGKQTEPIEKDRELAERDNCAFKGTHVTRGSGLGVVFATGVNTELGDISEMVESAEETQTPLEKRLDKLGRSLIWVVLALVALVAVLGIIRGKEVLLMIESAVALAVAAVPEGLPVVATIALGRGMVRMARRNALINRLASVETLGATNVICSDKTGTLTENRMTVAEYVLGERTVRLDWKEGDSNAQFKEDDREVSPDEDEHLRTALLIGMLCNNATRSPEISDREKIHGDVPKHTGLGDPMELALLRASAAAGMKRPEMIKDMPEEREEAFESETKMMGTFHRQGDEWLVAVKGAPEAVIDVCTTEMQEGKETQQISDERRKKWEDTNVAMAEDGLRVLALATKKVGSKDEEPYKNLTLIGLVGLRDPAREDVAEAIDKCHTAGIRVVMVTGDQPVTARKVAESIRLTDSQESEVLRGRELEEVEGSSKDRQRLLKASIFARVSPRQKLNLISLHQDNNSIVAMTGDGVNDAPALKKADIGIAMGKRGTQVARETADMILKDDSFSTIVVAVEQGRVIFNNIRKFVLYLLSGNVAEILAVAAASVANAPLPLLPLQILFLNFVIDVFPALALGVGEGDPRIMQQPPRPSGEPILTKRGWAFIGTMGAVIAVCGLGALALALGWLQLPQEQAITVSFIAIAFGRLFHVLNMRDAKSGLFVNEVTRNRWVWGAVVVSSGLILGGIFVPGVKGVLELMAPPASGWVLAMGAAVVPVVIGQVLKSTRVFR